MNKRWVPIDEKPVKSITGPWVGFNSKRVRVGERVGVDGICAASVLNASTFDIVAIFGAGSGAAACAWTASASGAAWFTGPGLLMLLPSLLCAAALAR